MNESRSFYEQMLTCEEPYRKLARCIHRVLGPCMALDIGCGVGWVPNELDRLGWNAFGADVDVPDDCQHCAIMLLDLTTPYNPDENFSWEAVICCETAEHIPAEYADNVVNHVTARSRRWIIWSAAQPGQEWEGHVNLQPPSYWLRKLDNAGFTVRAPLTAELRSHMTEDVQHHYCRENFYILERR